MVTGCVTTLVIPTYHIQLGNNPHGLYNQNKSLENYFDIVVGNYQSAIPRIFKKWISLKRILKAFAIYNFDVALDRAFRESRGPS